jgi:hypothetical protein
MRVQHMNAIGPLGTMFFAESLRPLVRELTNTLRAVSESCV